MYSSARPRAGGSVQRSDSRLQMSSSLMDTRNHLMTYEFLRMSSNLEQGWLDIDFSHSGSGPRRKGFQRCWVVFDSNETQGEGGALNISVDPATEPFLVIPMSSAISLKAESSSGLIKISTTGSQTFSLRADNPEEMKRWLFTFQRSVALILSALIHSSQNPALTEPVANFRDLKSINAHPSTILMADDRGSSGIPSPLASKGNLAAYDHSALLDRRGGFGRTTSVLGPPASESPTDRSFLNQSSGGVAGVLGGSSVSGNVNSLSSMTFSKNISIDADAMKYRQAHMNVTRPPPPPMLQQPYASNTSYLSSSFHPSSQSFLIPPPNNSINRATGSTFPGLMINEQSYLAKSPIIPIMSSMALSDRNDSEFKLAGSYVAPTGPSFIVDSVPDSLSNMNPTSSPDSASDADSVSDSDDLHYDGDMVFEMDGLDSPKRPIVRDRGGSSRNKSKRSSSGSSKNSSSTSNSTSNRSISLLTEALSATAIDSTKSQQSFSWQSGSCSLIGVKSSNEDRCVSLDELSVSPSQSSSSPSATAASTDASSLEKQGFFAVYDGHAGDATAIYLQSKLHDAICSHPRYVSDIVKAIEETCYEVDQKVLELCRTTRKESGSTALGIFLRGNQLVLFNIGDSCAVLSTQGQATEIMQKHSPNRPDELARIQMANGWITEEKDLYLAKLHWMNLNDSFVRSKAEKTGWSVTHRVCGEIGVSRSFGDPAYKNFTPGEKVEGFLWPEGHNQIFMADLLIPKPEFTTRAITADDDFLILASDGLWDVITFQESVDFVRNQFQLSVDCKAVAENLCNIAIRLGSADNVTTIIVKFIHA